MTITLPDEPLAGKDLGEAEIKLELALSLYALRKLSLIQAADLAGLDFFEFQRLMKDRGIPQHYSQEDFAADQATIAALP